MEPAFLAAIIGCMVAAGAGVFVAIQGSKNASKNIDNDETNSET